MTRRGRTHLTLFEALVVAAFGAACLWLYQQSSALPPGATALAAAYGPARNSEHYEEWIIRDFFHDRRDGVFLDVGANHYRAYSNTYFLERSLGWSGIAVEPIVAFEPDYRQHRPATKFRAFFASDISDSRARLHVLDGNHLVSSSEKSFTERFGNNANELEVPTITLTDLLDAEGVERIDFLSMDIELHEPKALDGFDIRRFRPALACIEAHPEVRQQILEYFARNGYVVVGKYLSVDEDNLYFAPLGSNAPLTDSAHRSN